MGKISIISWANRRLRAWRGRKRHQDLAKLTTHLQRSLAPATRMSYRAQSRNKLQHRIKSYQWTRSLQSQSQTLMKSPSRKQTSKDRARESLTSSTGLSSTMTTDSSSLRKRSHRLCCCRQSWSRQEIPNKLHPQSTFKKFCQSLLKSRTLACRSKSTRSRRRTSYSKSPLSKSLSAFRSSELLLNHRKMLNIKFNR